MPLNKKKLFIYIFPIFLLLFDQLIKYLAIIKIPTEGIFLIEKTNLEFALRLVKNPSLAFSIALPTIFIFLIIVSLILILFFFLYKAIKKDNILQTFSILLILAGALSNLVDRIIYGAVIDFVSIKILSLQFAVFNFADILIVLGVIILFIKEPFKVK